MSMRFNKIMNFFIVACMALCMTAGGSMSAFGATAQIAFSDPSVMAGNEVNVTMKISSTDGVPLDRVDLMLSYDPNKLEFISGTDANGGAGSIKVAAGAAEANTKLLSFSLKFKALSAGDTQIAVTTQEIYDGESQPFTLSKQGESKVKITPPASFSDDASLSSLKISPGSLTPGFSGDVTSYTATVGGDAERIAVNAGTSNANAKFAVLGNESLAMGENIITIKVTAEDGKTVKDYTIAVTKVEGVVEGTENSEKPEDTADGDGSIEAVSAKYKVVPLPEGVLAPEGLTEGEVEIAGRSIKGWVWSSGTGQQYFVFYGSNEKDETGFYRYDLTEKTVQRYFQDPNVDTGVSKEDYVQVAELYNKITKDYSNAIILVCVLGALAVILLISLICVLLIMSSKRKNRISEMPEKPIQPEMPERPIQPEIPKMEEEPFPEPKDEFLDEDIPEDFEVDFIFGDDEIEVTTKAEAVGGTEAAGEAAEQTHAEEQSEAVEEAEDAEQTESAEEEEDDFEFFSIEEVSVPVALSEGSPINVPEVNAVNSAPKLKARDIEEEDDFEFFEI